MDQIIINALKKKRELENELRKIEQFIETYEELSGTKIKRDEMTTASRSAQAAISRATELAESVQKRNNPHKIAMLARRLIEQAGTPLTRGELAENIEASGLTIYSDDKPRYIGTIMWRHKDIFENIEGEGYWIKGRPREDNSLPLE